MIRLLKLNGRTFVIAVAMIAGAFAYAADDAIRSPKAVDATAKYNADLKRIGNEYRQRVAEARRAYLAALKDALRDSAKAANPNSDEIARISAKIREIEKAVPADAPVGGDDQGRLTPDELVGKSFHFSAFSGPVRSQVTFEANGRVTGRDATWRIAGNKLMYSESAAGPVMEMDANWHGKELWFTTLNSFNGDDGQVHTLYPASGK